MMNKLTEASVLCGPSLKSASLRPPGDGEEISQYSRNEGYWQEKYDNMAHGIEKLDLPANRCDGKDSSPPSFSTTPPYLKWNEGLRHLLTDECGFELFLQYLKQEGHGKAELEFWFACEGIPKKWPQVQKDERRSLFSILFSHYVVPLSEISAQTKKDIAKKIESNDGLNCHIFDAAQREVEEAIMKTTYPNFLQSDLYIQYVQQMETECAQKDNVSEEASQSAEDCAKNENDNSKEGSPTKCNFGSVKNGSQEALDILPTLYEDSELELSNVNNKKALTRELLLQRRFSGFMPKARPESEAGHYLKASTPGYNTSYHTKYASYLPPSAQDSELQSLSSDALTDDNSSIVDYNPMSRPKCCSKKYEKHHRSSKQEATLINRDSFPNNFIPRTQRFEGKKIQDPNSEEFKQKLMLRLTQLQMEKQMVEKLHEEKKEAQSILDNHMSRVWSGSSQQTPNRTPGSLTPPGVQAYADVGGRQRVPPNGLTCNQIQSVSYPYSYGQYNKAIANPQYLQHHDSMRHQRDPDAYSCDSGTVHDYPSGFEPSVVSYPSMHEYLPESQHNDTTEHARRVKEQAKRSSGKKLSTWESRSSFDSGVGLTNIPIYNGTAQQNCRVSSWLATTQPMKCGPSDASESEREPSIHHKTSPSLSPICGQSSMKKPSAGNTMVNYGTLTSSSRSQWSVAPQPSGSVIESTVLFQRQIAMPAKSALAQNQNMTVLPPSDTTTQLMECRRRLEDSYFKSKSRSVSVGRERNANDIAKTKSFGRGFESQDDGTLHRKQTRKSYPNMMPSNVMPAPVEKTSVAYCFGRGSVPYLSKLPGKRITLKQFKSLLSKRGNFRYFFKKASEDYGIVFEEVTEDNEVLPLWEGKIFSIIEEKDMSSKY